MTKAVIYSRVSSEGNRQDTERQTNELIEYVYVFKLKWTFPKRVFS